MSLSAETRPSSREHKARLLITTGAVAACVGIALAVAGDDELSRWLVLGGVAVLVLGLHRFGRLGADPPAETPSASRE